MQFLCLCYKVENLFYNMAARRKTLQNSVDDYSKIVDLISRFAIHHINVGFSCRKVSILSSKTGLPQDMCLAYCYYYYYYYWWLCSCCKQHGAVRADVHTSAVSSRLDAIRSVYGVSVARNLMEIEASDDDPSSSLFEMNGFISNADYAAKKITMVLFINGIHYLSLSQHTQN